jgi:lipoic acid synthetase
MLDSGDKIMRPAMPEWLKVRARSAPQIVEVAGLVQRLSLHTVCDEAACPNRMECFSRQTATFMILGRACTRRCTFCNVEKRSPEPVDVLEPQRVAEAVKELMLRHVVITSVTRDDLPDGGAAHFARTIGEIRKLGGDLVVEVLIPDLAGKRASLARVVEAVPDIINHNVETVPRLYLSVRPVAAYERSLELLRNVKAMNAEIMTKSGIMLGLGEREDEVLEVLGDLREVGCDFATIGQYLAPSESHHPVIEYVHPEVFERYREACRELGFKHAAAGPFVRSSYRADEVIGSRC